MIGLYWRTFWTEFQTLGTIKHWVNGVIIKTFLQNETMRNMATEQICLKLFRAVGTYKEINFQKFFKVIKQVRFRDRPKFWPLRWHPQTPMFYNFSYLYPMIMILVSNESFQPVEINFSLKNTENVYQLTYYYIYLTEKNLLLHLDLCPHRASNQKVQIFSLKMNM